MSLYFITGNKGKFDEVKKFIPNIVQMDIDLPEIQSIDPREVIKSKLDEALKHHKGAFIVEDTSVYFELYDYKLPGPFMKGFLQALGNKRLAEIVLAHGKSGVKVEALIGYSDGKDHVHFFEGSISGEVLMPRGELSGFGWDPIFKPHGHDKTFAEMTQEEKNKISHRAQAVARLKDFLDNA